MNEITSMIINLFGSSPVLGPIMAITMCIIIALGFLFIILILIGLVLYMCDDFKDRLSDDERTIHNMGLEISSLNRRYDELDDWYTGRLNEARKDFSVVVAERNLLKSLIESDATKLEHRYKFSAKTKDFKERLAPDETFKSKKEFVAKYDELGITNVKMEYKSIVLKGDA